jgi:hypothetical protein
MGWITTRRFVHDLNHRNSPFKKNIKDLILRQPTARIRLDTNYGIYSTLGMWTIISETWPASAKPRFWWNPRRHDLLQWIPSLQRRDKCYRWHAWIHNLHGWQDGAELFAQSFFETFLRIYDGYIVGCMPSRESTLLNSIQNLLYIILSSRWWWSWH